jgi:hypothetical protein
MDIGGHVVLVVNLHELETLAVGLRQTADVELSPLDDAPENRPIMWAARRAKELLGQFPIPFKCPSFVYAGPGHQSKHECEIESLHPIEGEHRDFNTEWIGTASYEMVPQPWEYEVYGPDDMNIEPGGTWVSVDGWTWRRNDDGDGWMKQAPSKRKLINTEHNNDSCGCRGRW